MGGESLLDEMLGLTMTTRHPVTGSVTSIEGRRRLSTTTNQGSRDAGYWASLMAAIVSRQDVASFMAIYDHYSPRLLRYLQGLGVSEARGQELVQEAMLRLWRRADSFDPQRASLATWLYRVARNLYIDSARSEPQWSPLQDELDRVDEEAPRHETSVAEAYVDGVLLTQAIDALPAVQARLVRMSYLESKSHGEISAELGMPLGTVKSHLRRAFAKLQAVLLECSP